jgi:ATP-dependent DNA helicase RecG
LKLLGLDARLIKALLYIKENGSITNKKYQELLNVSKRTSTSDLQFLVDEDFLIKTGTRGPGTFYALKVNRQ